MKLWRQLSAVFRRRAIDAEMAEEMRLHLEQRTRENIAAGMPAGEAHYAALRKFGGVEQARELARDQRPGRWLESVAQDLRYAFRQLGRSPGFTIVVVLTLALGIGATTAIYSVVDRVVLNPIPGPDSDRLVQIGERLFIQNKEFLGGISPPVLEALEAAHEVFANITWSDSAQLERATEDFTTIEFGAMVPANFFSTFDAKPLLGRGFVPDEAVSFEKGPDRDGVIVLSHGWWKSQFGGDRGVLGTAIEMGGRRFTIVGVMPAHFQYPAYQVRYWLPAQPYRPQPRVIRSSNTQVVARLKPGVTQEQAAVVLNTIAQRLTNDYPASIWGYGEFWRHRPDGLRLWIKPLRAQFQDGRYAEELRRTLFGFLAAIGFVLVIVCANVANLALARTERRQQELAIRAALGAGRGRLMRQLLTENLLLACLGGSAGLVLAAWGMQILAALNSMPRLRPIELDANVLAVALVVSLLTGLVFGVAPAWRAGRARINDTLTQSGAGATAGRRGSRYRDGLVLIQVALTVVLLAGAGLMLRSVILALRVNPGFDAANLVTAYLQLGGPHRRAPRTEEESAALLASRNALLEDVRARLAGLPGVRAAGILRENYPAEKITPDGAADPVEVLRTYCGVEESDVFRAARIPIIAGRTFDRNDIGETATSVVVNETMARLCWPGTSAIGQTFLAPPVGRGKARTYEVVGVVGDVRLQRFDEVVKPAFFRPYQESGQTGMRPAVLVRTENDPALLVAAIRKELKAASADLMMPEILVARQVLFDSTQAQRTYRNYLLVFAGVGLLLSALGIYGVLSYSVARRTREIGIRMAIGAGRGEVLAMIMRDGVRLILAGVVVGVIAAFWLTRFLQKQLFAVSATDPLVFAAVVVVLSAVGLIACYLPARRAARVDPLTALRCE